MGMSIQDEISIPLLAEELVVSRREAVLGSVRVHVQTHLHDQLVDEMLAHERVDIERVAIGRVVDSVPAVREEGDTTIVPVVEEIVVVERRLVLKEEVRMTRVRTRERHTETVSLREQQATVERTGPRHPALAPINQQG